MSVLLAALYLCDFIFKHAYTELVTVKSSLMEASLEMNFPHNGQVSACKAGQRAEGQR